MRLLRCIRGDVEQIAVSGIGSICPWNRAKPALRLRGDIGSHVEVNGISLPEYAQIVCRLPQEANPRRPLVHFPRIACIGSTIGSGNVVETFAPFIKQGNTRRELIADRQIERALRADILVITITAADKAVVPSTNDRVLGVDKHRAASRILANDCPLWTAQDLDVRHVVIGFSLEKTGETGNAVAISDHASGGNGAGFSLTDAADVEFETLTEIVDHYGGADELE